MAIPLVVGIDGSEASLEAVDWAADEAVRHDVPLHLLHAAARDDERVDVISGASKRARAGAPSVRLSSEVLHEDAAAALVDKGRNAFALVLGSRGLGDLAGMLLARPAWPWPLAPTALWSGRALEGLEGVSGQARRYGGPDRDTPSVHRHRPAAPRTGLAERELHGRTASLPVLDADDDVPEPAASLLRPRRKCSLRRCTTLRSGIKTCR